MGSRAIGQESCSGGGEQELACWFDLGLALQVQADSSQEPGLKSALLARAAAFYERALALDSNSGAVLNNLAQVYADQGREADAEPLFQRAIRLEVPLRPFFLRNYADFLRRRGDCELRPQDYPAHEGLVTILSQHRPEELAQYLWFLVGQGQTVWAEEIVLKTWEEKRVPRDQKEEYLALLVACEAAQSYLPEEFSSSRAAAVITSLSRDPEIGEGALEVLRVHEGTDFAPGSYSWWAERARTGSGGSAPEPPSPRQVFRNLLRSLGDALHRSERYDAAHDYLRLAVLLISAEPDLLAFRRLINLPMADEDVAAIDRLAEGNEKVILRKGPKQADLALYRHDLGLFYGFLRHWKGKGPTSGIYQLSQATHMGGVGPPDGPPDTPIFDARIYTRLAEGYAETGKPEQARQTLYDLVDAYRSHGMGAEAAALQVVLNSGQGRRRPPDRRREIFDDPPLPLRDFTTEPPGPPP
jgi:tetratricopeptide (TPR) repeat protein